MKRWHIASVVALVACSTGCGLTIEESSPAAAPAAVNAAAAGRNAEAAIAAALAAKEGQGAGSVSSFVSLGASTFSLLSPGATGQSAQVAPQLVAAFGQGEGEAAGVDCSESSCIFEGYSPDGEYTVDGTVSWVDDHVVADLTIATLKNGMSFAFQTTADLVVTGTSIDGSVTSAGTVVVPQAQQYGASGEFAWEASVEYHDLAFADGTPVGGSMHVNASLSSGDESYAGDVTVSFP